MIQVSRTPRTKFVHEPTADMEPKSLLGYRGMFLAVGNSTAQE
jgi:hypothetical protein